MAKGRLLNLLIRAALAAAGSAALPGFAAEPAALCAVGPFDLAGTRESIQALTAHGPYVPVRVTGGFETFNANIAGAKANVSFVFGPDERLQFIQHFAYEGPDMAEAEARFQEIAAAWTDQLGGFRSMGFRADGSDVLTAASAGKLFHALVRIPADTFEKASASSKQVFYANSLFQATPVNQPEGCNLHMLYGHRGQTKTSFILYFVDRKDHVRKFPRLGIAVDVPQKGEEKTGG